MRRRDAQRSDRWGQPSGLRLLGFWFFARLQRVLGRFVAARVS
ncbi:hypothetical protein OO015_09515 [Thermomicrobium sp. 4228-Ro]|nr:hypothetical protein [Thermomicrobium sp. 4228-Ro]MCX2727724.1 hypothetical protein [Thermomicrobium sp. 4228-Ro]